MSTADDIPELVVLPISLYKSLQGRYFVGYADNVDAAIGLNAWAGLFNPVDSGVILHVNVITVTNVIGEPFNAEFWIDAQFSGTPILSNLLTPANTALTPPPVPKVEILMASNVSPMFPTEGIMIYSQLMYKETTVVYETDGRYLIPPGGSMAAYLNLIKSQTTGRVAFGWWEDPIPWGCSK